MADETTPSQSRDDQGGRAGGGRQPGNREPGGFRIRLSDNEIRAARAIQEGFALRSTVAALGFAIRTVAQLLEEGKLDELVIQQRAQAGPRGDTPRVERRTGGGEGRVIRQERAPRIDPFARPSKPPAPVADHIEPNSEEDAGASIEELVPEIAESAES
ncbi:MAG: hypothetical protein O2839_02900 [Cyanobacteria bacterium]|nr:hypothetical protein [Cyanobacteriota bacterium]MDA1246159.1 hypothetical protein [Cyanobacteriota bacterium]